MAAARAGLSGGLRREGPSSLAACSTQAIRSARRELSACIPTHGTPPCSEGDTARRNPTMRRQVRVRALAAHLAGIEKPRPAKAQQEKPAPQAPLPSECVAPQSAADRVFSAPCAIARLCDAQQPLRLLIAPSVVSSRCPLAGQPRRLPAVFSVRCAGACRYSNPVDNFWRSRSWQP